MRGITRLTLAVVIVSALVLTGCGTRVPDLKGKTAEQAERVLSQAGFKIGKVSYDEKAQGAPGAVIGQEPEATARAAEGSIINITVAGPPPVAVPNILGLKQAEAAAALSAVGLTVGDATPTYSTTAAAGVLMSQTPAAGGLVSRGSVVPILVSKGPQPVDVPSVVGKSSDEAKRLLEAKGFRVAMSERADSAKKGTVLSQDPTGGRAVQRGATVKVVVSSGVELVRVPNVLADMRNHEWRNSYDENPNAIAEEVIAFVEDRLADAGLRGECVLQQIEQAEHQSPKAGAMVPRGTLVKVYVPFGD